MVFNASVFGFRTFKYKSNHWTWKETSSTIIGVIIILNSLNSGTVSPKLSTSLSIINLQFLAGLFVFRVRLLVFLVRLFVFLARLFVFLSVLIVLLVHQIMTVNLGFLQRCFVEKLHSISLSLSPSFSLSPFFLHYEMKCICLL